jgi:hypothetical protein
MYPVNNAEADRSSCHFQLCTYIYIVFMNLIQLCTVYP